MRLGRQRHSSNVEDRRGRRRVAKAGAGLGLGGVVLIVAIALLLGEDPTRLLEVAEQASSSRSAATDDGEWSAAPAPASDAASEFVAAVLGSTEDVWAALFARSGGRYEEPRLVIFDDRVSSACGLQSSAVGPFYCPADSAVYLDVAFFGDLSRRYGAPGDFAQAYVIAHEVGHHVQNLRGTSSRVHDLRRRVGRTEANELSVRLELQADCFAGTWAHHAHGSLGQLEPGDLEEGLEAAAAIGDDRLQRRSRGQVVPESFTHGTSAQRVRWFRRGFETGDPNACDTFEAGAR